LHAESGTVEFVGFYPTYPVGLCPRGLLSYGLLSGYHLAHDPACSAAISSGPSRIQLGLLQVKISVPAEFTLHFRQVYGILVLNRQPVTGDSMQSSSPPIQLVLIHADNVYKRNGVAWVIGDCSLATPKSREMPDTP